MEQGNLPTQRVNISTQKILGGIGSILILLVFIPETVAILLGIVGFVLWLISMYQLSNILRKPSIFQKVLISLVLSVASVVIDFAFELTALIPSFVSPKDEMGAILGGGLGVVVAIIVGYAIVIAISYFYKEAYDILAQATAHNLFKIGGILFFIGAITIILFGLGLLLIVMSNVVLAVAFFTAPNEVEVQGT